MANESIMISLSEAIRRYGIPRTTFEIAIKNEEIPIYKLQGKARYFKRIEIDAWIDKKRVVKIPLLKIKL